MNALDLVGDLHAQRIDEARQSFFNRGDLPIGVLPNHVASSWERCRRFGLDENEAVNPADSLDRVALKSERQRNDRLLAVGRSIMEYVYDQIRDSGSMVILADTNGLLLDTVGDPDFVNRADRVSLSAGASWDETQRGTNAIGTALVEETPIEVLGAEHFMRSNTFLTCCASPIFGSDGKLLGVLDISGDYRSYQRHTLGLARMATGILERRLFESAHSRDIILAFHRHAHAIGSPSDGLVAISPEGQILAVNPAALDLLGIRRVEAVNRDFSIVFENSLGTLVDRARTDPVAPIEFQVGGQRFYGKLNGQFPSLLFGGRVFEEAATPSVSRKPRRPEGEAQGKASPLCLDRLNTGDPRLEEAIRRSRRILGRDIPMMIQGESGSGKEIFAKAFHCSGPRVEGTFVALNCAAIPETLIESELFGYQGGAFTGSRKEGSPGKIQMAHGGTLFLDEIGDMPLNLQARLLRVLQERSVTPLGSARAIQVDISLICATHRNLREEVARGNFREDLYYRLNGLCITLPPLRERTDIRALIDKFATEEAENRDLPVRFTEPAYRAMEAYGWPGNIRQLANVIRVMIALLDDDETLITESHLPEEFFEARSCPLPEMDSPTASTAQTAGAPLSTEGSLEEIGRQVALRALDAAGGNISAAARKLGISRNTLYRKLGRF